MNVEQSEKRCLSSLCSLLGYSRQAYYQHQWSIEKEALESELLIQEVLRIRDTQRRIGTRKLLFMMTAFMERHRINIGRDSFFELLRVHNLLVRKRRRKPRTTFSCFWFKKYPNLVKDFIPTGPNQLWVSDITYIAIGDDFGYLSLITDAYSHKVVGFYLSEDLTAVGCILALKMALRNNPELDNLIHHSDRGLQYYSAAYVKLLEPNIRISMSENSDPLENAIAERMNGILKDEFLSQRYETFSEAKREVAVAISIYNYQRPHCSIDMLTPAVAHQQNGELKKRWKNYYKPRKKEVLMDA